MEFLWKGCGKHCGKLGGNRPAERLFTPRVRFEEFAPACPELLKEKGRIANRRRRRPLRERGFLPIAYRRTSWARRSNRRAASAASARRHGTPPPTQRPLRSPAPPRRRSP